MPVCHRGLDGTARIKDWKVNKVLTVGNGGK